MFPQAILFYAHKQVKIHTAGSKPEDTQGVGVARLHAGVTTPQYPSIIFTFQIVHIRIESQSITLPSHSSLFSLQCVIIDLRGGRNQ